MLTGIIDRRMEAARGRGRIGLGVFADLLITNGTLWRRRLSSGLAIKGDRIIAVAPDEKLKDLAGPRTRVLDVGGKSVLPAFQDAHLHPAQGGFALTRCNLHEVSGENPIRRAIADYVAQRPAESWILGSGWEEDISCGWLNKKFLDAIVPDRPVLLMGAGLHDAWVNSVALRMAGIDAASPEPPDGYIGRQDDGEPSGLLHEGAVRLVEKVTPATQDSDTDDALLTAQSHLHRLGITAWQDAWTTPEVLGAYQRLTVSGQLTARVTAALWWDRLAGEEQIDGLVEQREASYLRNLRATSVKIMVDGTTGNFTASVLEPYLDEQGMPTSNYGLPFVEPDKLARVVARLDAHGFQVHFHAIGEASVRSSLDAVEAARRLNGWSDLRHHIAHVCLVHPDDRSRFSALDVTANIQPYWAAASPDMIRESRFLGYPRSNWWYPFESMRAAGTRLAGGSDWPVSTADPLREAHVAVNRALPGTGEEPFMAHERLSLSTTLDAFTSGAAYVNHLDDRTGDLTVGKLADIIVIDRNLESCEAQEIGSARVLLTLLAGNAVYQDPALG